MRIEPSAFQKSMHRRVGFIGSRVWNATTKYAPTTGRFSRLHLISCARTNRYALLAFACALALTTAASFCEERVVFSDSVRALPVGVGSRGAMAAPDLTVSMEFMLSLKMRDFNGLLARIGAGQLIAPAEMAEKYFPLPADYKAASDWLSGQGFTITGTDPNRLCIFARGTAAQIQAAMQVSFANVAANGKTFVSAAAAPSLPASVAAPVLGINGLQPHFRKHVHSHIVPGKTKFDATSSAPPFFPSQLLAAYNAAGLSVSGAGQTIGIVIDTPPATADLTQFWATTGVAQSLSNITFVQAVQGTNGAPSGEETLDTEWSSSMAPNAKVRVYVTTDLSDVNIDKGYQAIIADLPNQPALKQVSCSFGGDETQTPASQMNTDAQFFATMASSGVSVFVSTGDNGSKPDGAIQISSPSNDPSVTAVGGTSLFLTATNGVASETVWNGSGGGTSGFFSRPAFQTGNGVPAGGFRLNPDISSAADPNTGCLIILGGQQMQIGGTSWSAPTWAGFCALINEARGNASLPSAGLLGPKLYPLIGTASFRDITSGSNGDFSATAGFDLCTGIGVPNVASLIGALGGAASNAPTIASFTPPSGPQGTTVTVTGTNFTAPVTVSFNGVAAAPGLFTTTQAMVQVPAGATTGPISVTTSAGTAASATSFTVTAGNVSGLPNLIPFAAPGWTSAIAVTNVANGTTDVPRLTVGDSFFVSLSFANVGTVAINSAFSAELDVDGAKVNTSPATVPLAANGAQSIQGIPIGLLTLGSHTLTMILDPGNAIAESSKSDNMFTRTILVQGPLPNASVAATASTADANANTQGTYTVTLSSAQLADVTVSFTTGGTAVSGVDFMPIGKSVVVPTGKTTATVTVTPLFNALATGPSTLELSLAAGAGYIATDPQNATITVKNIPPPIQFTSAATATPNPALVGQTIAFSATATTSTSDTITVTWDFGDGTTGAGATVTKTYMTPGTFTAVATAADSNLTAASSVSVTVSAMPMQISMAMLRFNFRTTGRDSLSIAGTLPMGSGYVPNGDNMTLTIGSFIVDFPLNPRGTSTGPGLNFALRGRIKQGQFTDSVLKFTLRLTNQDLFTALNPSPGFSDTVSKSGVVLPVVFTFSNNAFVGSRTLNYVTNGKTGTAK